MIANNSNKTTVNEYHNLSKLETTGCRLDDPKTVHFLIWNSHFSGNAFRKSISSWTYVKKQLSHWSLQSLQLRAVSCKFFKTRPKRYYQAVLHIWILVERYTYNLVETLAWDTQFRFFVVLWKEGNERWKGSTYKKSTAVQATDSVF